MPSQIHLRFNKKTLDRGPLPAADNAPPFTISRSPVCSCASPIAASNRFASSGAAREERLNVSPLAASRRYRWNAPESRQSDTSRISERALASVHGCATRHSKEEHSRKCTASILPPAV